MAAKSDGMSGAAFASLPAGTRLGRYEVIRPIARGGMGEVYLGRLRGGSAARVVALKVLRPEFRRDESVRAMFLEEAATLLRLDHTAVVRAIELVDDADHDVLVMEFIRGRSVSELLQRWRELPATSPAVAVELVVRIARAVHYVHEATDVDGNPLGLVHRDLSPDNAMLRPDGGVKLIDFGIARATVQTSVTSAGVLKGKVSYMSPEQLRQDPLDRRSDIFQLGTMLYELVTGVHPFSANNFAATMNAILSGDVPRPRSGADPVEPALAKIMLRALEFEPEDRHETAAMFAEELEDFLADSSYRIRESDLEAEFSRVFGVPNSALETTSQPTGVRPAEGGRRRWAVVGSCSVLALSTAVAAVAQWSVVSAATTERDAMEALWTARGLAGLGGVLAAAAVGVWAWGRRRTAAAVTTLLVSSGCGAPERPCRERAPCDLHLGGVCDAKLLRCAYADASCEGGYRFGPFAGEAADACADPRADASWVWAPTIGRAATVDGDPSELMLGPPLVIPSDFGVRAELWFRASDEGLYVGAVVEDPQLEASRPPHEPLWNEDGIEILFDTDWDRAAGPMPHADDYKFVVTAINSTSVSWGGVSPRTAWSLPIVSAVRTRGTVNQPADVDDGYDVELFVPWDDGFRRPEPGTAWGVNVQVNDLHGGASREVAWRSDTPLNHPRGAGVLGFGPDGPPFEATRTPHAPAPIFERLKLDDAVRSVDTELRDDQGVEHMVDGCLAPQRACTVATDHASTVSIDFDLGTVHDLGGARLFGDTRHDWVSRTWSLRVRTDPEEPWQIVVDSDSAFSDAWHFRSFEGVAARFLRLSVAGTEGSGVEFNEFQVLGRR